MSSGTGRREALACGVETSPEEYEGRVSLSGAVSAVGTRAMTETGDGVRSRLNGARTTPGISPRARSRSLGRDDSFLGRLARSTRQAIRATRGVDFGGRWSRSPHSLLPHPLLLHVTSSGAGRRAALACGVERSPEEYEGGLLLGGASSAEGTGTTTQTVLGSAPDSTALVRLRRSLDSLRSLEMTGFEGDQVAFYACHPERSRGVS